jgi:hypothetical protein
MPGAGHRHQVVPVALADEELYCFLLFRDFSKMTVHLFLA